jgi:hypothetical protein
MNSFFQTRFHVEQGHYRIQEFLILEKLVHEARVHQVFKHLRFDSLSPLKGLFQKILETHASSYPVENMWMRSE